MKPTGLDDLMTPVTDCLDRKALRALVDLRATPEAQERMDWLAVRANEGMLTDEERSEYESCAMFASILGIMQSKARKKLATAP